MLYSLLLALLPVVHGITHNATTYDEYPNCANTCLSYNGTEYPNNFANNCDYASGECCTSPYSAIITATWECVWSHCGREESLEAFGTFVEFCEDMKHPLRKEDIPKGYEPVVEGSGDEEGEGKGKGKDDDDNFAGTGLSKTQIIGIAVGAGVTATVTAIGLVLKCCFQELWESCMGRGGH